MNTKKLTMLALLTAIVVVLQLVVRIPVGMFSLSTVLVPIVIGAALYGPLAGIWLGLVFGVVVLVSGDATFFMGLNPAGTIIMVVGKGIACGAAAGLVYKLLVKKNEKVAVVCASVITPIVNTGVFILGCLAFYNYGIREILVMVVGLNFFIELGVNIVLSAAILFIIETARKMN